MFVCYHVRSLQVRDPDFCVRQLKHWCVGIVLNLAFHYKQHRCAVGTVSKQVRTHYWTSADPFLSETAFFPPVVNTDG